MNNSNINNIFGKRLKELRENRGLFQEDVGEWFQMKKSTVSQWESGRFPHATIITKLAQKFNVTTDYLLGVSDSSIDHNAEAVQKIDDALEDHDPELLEFWLETKKRPDLQIFLKQVKSLSPKAIRQMMAIIKAIEDEEENE